MAIRYRPLRQRRINRLMQYGFTKQEAINFTKMKTEYPDGSIRYSTIILSRPYVRLMMRERYHKVKQALKEGKTAKQIKDMINKEYIDNGWLTKDGRHDYWKMFRYWYRQAITLGSYKPPPKKYDPNKPHRKMGEGGIDREHVRKQAQKYRDKGKTQPPAVSGNQNEWIAQLRKRMNETKSDRQKEQYRSQIINLGGTP